MVHEAGKYRVKRGDSLWKIAEHEMGHGSEWHALAEANHLKPTAVLLVGQFLTIPRRKSSTVARPGPVPAPQPQRPGMRAPSTETRTAPAPRAGAATDRSHWPARPVLFPKFQYKMDKSVVTFPVAGGTIECKINADFSVQQQGTITAGLTFTQKGLEVEYKAPADDAVKHFFTSCTASIEGNEAKLTLATGAVVKQGDRVIMTTQIELGPEGPEYVAKGEELKFTYRGFEFAGQLSYRMIFHPHDDSTGSHLAPSSVPAHATNWKKAVGVGLILAAVVIVVADAAKDVGTLGGGAVETPLSWAAAGRMFASGLGMMRMVTP